jgi:hypothetical protein
MSKRELAGIAAKKVPTRSKDCIHEPQDEGVEKIGVRKQDWKD